MDISKTISNLKFISNIPIGHKLNINFMITEPNTILTATKRTFLYGNETRTKTKDFIETTINRAFEILNSSYCNQENINYIKKLLIELNNSISGISNLRQTYHDDIHFCGELDTVIDKIKIEVNKFEMKYNINQVKDAINFNTDEHKEQKDNTTTNTNNTNNTTNNTNTNTNTNNNNTNNNNTNNNINKDDDINNQNHNETNSYKKNKK